MATVSIRKRSLRPSSEPKIKKRSTKKLQLVWLVVFQIAFIAIGFFLYLSSFNHITSQGVILDQLGRERTELIIENEVWNMRIAQLKALDRIEDLEVVRRMERINPSEIEFINLDEQLQASENDKE